MIQVSPLVRQGKWRDKIQSRLKCWKSTYSLIRFRLRKGLSDELVGPFLGLVLRVGHDAGYDERHDDDVDFE